MSIALGSDHAGLKYKEAIKKHLTDKGIKVIDFGTNSEEACDYPNFVRPVAEAVAKGETDYGIVLGGSGNGEAIVANKVKGVRCSLCWSHDTAKWARGHNNANVLAIGQRTIPLDLAIKIVDIWLSTPFDGGRHQRRVDLITEIENKWC
ncbi:MAG: ribose 5-phosphate isomerase B [Candidatus Ratteibacteria bacterium]|nr:ribose 5-phosphate isomerase B [Candidatus Ratteibacteria bacterium]